MVVIVGALAMLLGGTAAFGAALGTPYAPCFALGNGIDIHFLVDTASQARPAMSGVVLSGLDPLTCDNQPVVVTFYGNPQGDPDLRGDGNLPPVWDEQLAVLDSTENPCNFALPAVPQVIVAGGSITLHGCATVTDPSHAAYVSIHDLTLMSVQVNGHDVPVNPPTTTPGTPVTTPASTAATATATATTTATATPTATPTASPTGDVSGEMFSQGGSGPSAPVGTSVGGTHVASSPSLPFTGTWAALTFWLGLLLVLFGVLLLLLGRRAHPDTEPAPPASP